MEMVENATMEWNTKDKKTTRENMYKMIVYWMYVEDMQSANKSRKDILNGFWKKLQGKKTSWMTKERHWLLVFVGENRRFGSEIQGAILGQFLAFKGDAFEGDFDLQRWKRVKAAFLTKRLIIVFRRWRSRRQIWRTFLFGAVSKDDADNRDQQSHRNILYSILSCYASFWKLSNEIFSSHNWNVTRTIISHKQGVYLVTIDWLYAWLTIAWPIDWHIDWFSRF